MNPYGFAPRRSNAKSIPMPVRPPKRMAREKDRARLSAGVASVAPGPAAVLASVPFTALVFVSTTNASYAYYHPLLAPFQTQFLVITVFLILLTLATTTVGVVHTERLARRESEEKVLPTPPPPPTEFRDTQEWNQESQWDEPPRQPPERDSQE